MDHQKINITKWISLRPYGRQLLSPMASVWLTSMSIIIYLMCIVEGATWGLIATFLFDAPHKWLGWPAGIMVALLFYIFDTSLANTDLPHDPMGKGFRLTLLFKPPLGGMTLKLAVRICILVFSWIITAPFISQLMLYDDINAALARTNAHVRVEIINGVRQKYDQQIQVEQSRLDELFHERNLEAAGAGRSGKRGEGAAYKALTEQIQTTRQRLARIRTDYKKELDLVTGATAEELQKRYGAHFVPNTLDERKRIQDKMQAAGTHPEFGVDEIAKLLLTLIFATMMVLKVLQPKGVYIYQSEMLQGLYEKYRHGGLDPYVPEIERFTGPAPMNAYRFHDWVHSSYLKDRDREAREELVTGYHTIISLLKDEAGELRPQIMEKQQVIDDHTREHQRLNAELRATNTQLKANACLIADRSKELQDMQETLGAGLPSEARAGFYSDQKGLSDQLAQLRGEGQQLSGRKEDLEDACSMTAKTIEALRAEWHELRDLEKMVKQRISHYKDRILETHDKRLNRQHGALKDDE